MTTKLDIVSQILDEAYLEVVGRDVLTPAEIVFLRDRLNDFYSFGMDDRNATGDEIYIHSKKSIKREWKD